MQPHVAGGPNRAASCRGLPLVGLWPQGDPRQGRGEIVHLGTGRKIRLHRRGGVYALRMWVPAAGAEQGRGNKAASGFPRPGAL